MMLFWTIAVLLVGVALFFVLPPLRQRQAQLAGPTQKALDVAVYREQLAELEADLRNGNLDTAQFEQARSDLQRTLLETVSDEASTRAMADAGGASGKRAALVVGIAVPVLAVSLYLALGTGAAAIDPEQMTASPSDAGHAGSVEDMVASLRKRLETNPANPAGWVMLARSYYVLGRYAEAGAAYESAMEHGAGDEPDVLAGYADVLAAQQDRRLDGKPMELVRRALQHNPNHAKSLWLAGTAAYQANDYQSARDYWNRLAALLPPGSEDADVIQANLAELDRLSGGEATSAAKPAAQMTIQGMVELAPALADRVASTDTVFVTARAVNGPKMPLAAMKRQAKDLPLSFTLDDSMVMMPGTKLSDFAEVEVTARISKSGNAITQAGDLRAKSVRITSGVDERVQLLVDEIVK